MLEELLRHAFGEIYDAVIIENFDATNILAVDFCLVGNRTDDIARLYPVSFSNLKAEPLHTNIQLLLFAYLLALLFFCRFSLRLTARSWFFRISTTPGFS